MHSDTINRNMLTTRGIGCLAKLDGNPARQTSGRTLDHVAKVYDLLEPLMMFGLDRVIRREVVAILSLKGSEKVLDVGCGTGTLTRQIAGALPDSEQSCVVGVDAATAMIDVARRKAKRLPNVAFEAALAEQLPFADGSFDCAVSTMFFHHINADLKTRALNEIWRTLVPGGKTVIVDITPPTNLFGTICVWSGYFLFQQAEIRENIEGKLEAAFDRSKFRTWRSVAHHAGYVSVYVLERYKSKKETKQMKQNIKIRILIAVLAIVEMSSARADTEGDRMAGAVSNYVAGVMKGLQGVADQQPTVDTFRTQMKPFVEATPGVFGASLIDTNFVIRQVYYRRDFLAVGFDLKRVSELDYFWKLIQKKPEPQLSEPGHGSLIQPRLVAMRYPIMVNGRFKGIVSVMIHTDDFLKAVGLDNCSAFKIICLGKLAEEKGELAAKYHESKLSLPSTEWVIQFQK